MSDDEQWAASQEDDHLGPYERPSYLAAVGDPVVMSAEEFEQLSREHVPNTPRTHDGQGHRLVEALQCRKCLHAWPCAYRLLLDRVIELEAVIIEAAHEISLAEDAYREQFGELPSEDEH
jgi:hypothetical protein